MEKQIENEKMVLSACLHEYEVLEYCIVNLDVKDFFYELNKDIFTVMRDLACKKLTVSKPSVSAELKLSDKKNALSWLIDFYNERLDIEFLKSKIEEIKLFSIGKQLQQKCMDGVKFFGDHHKTRVEMQRWVDDLAKILSIGEGKSWRTLNDIINKYAENPDRSFIQVVQERQERHKNGDKTGSGYQTCYKDIDNVFDGFKPGHLTIIGARPGVGKTTFALNLMLKQMVTNQVPVGFFSLEMTGEEIVKNILFCRAGLESREFERGSLNGDDFQRLYQTAKELSSNNLTIDDTGRLNLSIMESKAKYWKDVFGIKILFIDYLQLINAGGKFNTKYEEVTAISQRLKLMAKNLNIPVICLAQLNRQSAGSEIPKAHDLRDSGSIEQDADEIFLLHSPSSGPEPTDKYNKTDILQVHLVKNRHGGVGNMELVFMKNLCKIESLERTQNEHNYFNPYKKF